MANDPFSFVGDVFSGLNDMVSDKNLKKAGKLVNKVLSIVLGILSIVFLSGTAAFVILGLTVFPAFFVGAVLLGIPGFIILGTAIKMSKGRTASGFKYSKQHQKDIKALEATYKNAKNLLSGSKIDRSEKKHISEAMKKELTHAKSLSKNIEMIISTLNRPEANISAIESKIKDEKAKASPNERLIKALEAHVSNIKLLDKRVKMLKEEISNLRVSFTSILSMITVLDTQQRKSDYDEIESEIQKILDFKIRVAKHEEELKKELQYQSELI